MQDFLFCPVKDCETEPSKVLDVRAYFLGEPWPQALVCVDHYNAIMDNPKGWRFSHSWDHGLVIESRKKTKK